MKKLDLKNTAANNHDTNILHVFSKKEKIGKTIFKLPPDIIKTLQELSKRQSSTMRGFLEGLAEIAEEAHEKNLLPTDKQKLLNGERKSYTISEKAKNTFERIAHERKISRDMVVLSTLSYLIEEIKKTALNPQEKIDNANQIISGIEKMCEIYENEVMPSVLLLKRTGDRDFSKHEELFNYLEHCLYELPLNMQTLKGEKEHEINSTCT